MVRRGRFVPVVLALLGGCGPPAAPPAPPSLGYGEVRQPAAVYAFGDTARVEIDAGGRTVDADVSAGATLDIRFRPAPGGVTVTASFRDFSARATHPAADSRTVRVADFGGPLVFSLDRRGVPTLIESPGIPGEAARFLAPDVLAATLLPRLPGRAVTPGHRWTDTVRVDAETADTRVEGASIVTYTVRGDTAVGARSLLEVTLVARDRRRITGNESGMRVSRSLTGGSTGWFLWDLHRGLLHESVYDTELTGTMEIASAPFPLSLRVRSRTELRLVDAPAEG